LFHHTETFFQISEFLAVLLFYLVELMFQLFDRIVLVAFGRHVGGLGEEQARDKHTEKECEDCHDIPYGSVMIRRWMKPRPMLFHGLW
jgi:hypothetical protein